jgi:hypothetical protein
VTKLPRMWIHRIHISQASHGLGRACTHICNKLARALHDAGSVPLRLLSERDLIDRAASEHLAVVGVLLSTRHSLLHDHHLKACIVCAMRPSLGWCG